MEAKDQWPRQTCNARAARAQRADRCRRSVRRDDIQRSGCDSAIHQTQLQCVASLLRKGTPLDDVVASAPKPLGGRREIIRVGIGRPNSFGIEQQGLDFIAKNRELLGALNDRLFANWQKVTETLTPDERPSTGINRFGAYFRGPHTTREPKDRLQNSEHPAAGGNSPSETPNTGKARGWNSMTPPKPRRRAGWSRDCCRRPALASWPGNGDPSKPRRRSTCRFRS